MKELTVNELCNCIDKALQLALKQQGKREYLGEKIQEASFEGYGNRYNHFLQKLKIIHNEFSKKIITAQLGCNSIL